MSVKGLKLSTEDKAMLQRIAQELTQKVDSKEPVSVSELIDAMSYNFVIDHIREQINFLRDAKQKIAL